MLVSEKTQEISKALSQFQAQIQPIGKNSSNPHFKSKYASLDSILDAIRPVLHACGLAITQAPETNGNCLVVTTRLLHASGEFIESALSIPVTNPTAQAIGSATTYARRYAISAMLGLSTEEDEDGTAATNHAPATAKKVAKPVPEAAPAPVKEAAKPAEHDNLLPAINSAVQSGLITKAEVSSTIEVVCKRRALWADLHADERKIVHDRIVKLHAARVEEKAKAANAVNSGAVQPPKW